MPISTQDHKAISEMAGWHMACFRSARAVESCADRDKESLKMRGARLFAACLCLVALTAVGCGSDDSKGGDDPGNTPGQPGQPGKPGSPGTGGTGGSMDPNVEPGAQPVQGATDFVSADTGGGQNGVGGRGTTTAPASG